MLYNHLKRKSKQKTEKKNAFVKSSNASIHELEPATYTHIQVLQSKKKPNLTKGKGYKTSDKIIHFTSKSHLNNHVKSEITKRKRKKKLLNE